mgnify:CR=1 FL=1
MRNEALGKRVVKALESRNMEAYYASTKEEAVQKALELMEEGSSVTMGGSMSVRESGLLDAINAGNYEFYDRDQAATPEERQEIALKAFTCDWYLGSVNAMSKAICVTIQPGCPYFSTKFAQSVCILPIGVNSPLLVAK